MKGTRWHTVVKRVIERKLLEKALVAGVILLALAREVPVAQFCESLLNNPGLTL